MGGGGNRDSVGDRIFSGWQGDMRKVGGPYTLED